MNPEVAQLVEELVQVARELPMTSVVRLATILEGAAALTTGIEAAMLATVVQPASRERVGRIVARWREIAPVVPPVALAWALQAACACDGWHRAQERTDLVWTGPATISQGIYRTHETLLDLIESAKRSLLIVTFAAYRMERVREALWAAAQRGVDVVLVVETDEGRGGKIDKSPLRELTGGPDGVRVFEWPVELRPRDGDRYGTLHAKCALADEHVLFVSSANMTGAALELNMELGILIRGGPVPTQAAKHFNELMLKGVLRCIEPGSR